MGLGMHVLYPREMTAVADQFAPYRAADESLYVTIPFTLADMDRLGDWQAAFDVAREKNIIPLVRLATEYDPEHDYWRVPTRKDIVELTKALNRLDWPQEERHVILFNEPNHAKEWGGRLDPHEFARITDFALDWFGTENAHYALLPAALDLAAPDSRVTKEAFGYWREVLGSKPEILDKITAWNSHSYPNPGFASAPQRSGKNSLRGFESELAFLNRYTDRKLEVFITETGWDTSAVRSSKLPGYYQYALQSIWSDEQVKAVTPFVFAGSPGPFSGFSFRDEKGQPTGNWEAFRQALEANGGKIALLHQ